MKENSHEQYYDEKACLNLFSEIFIKDLKDLKRRTKDRRVSTNEFSKQSKTFLQLQWGQKWEGKIYDQR